MYFFDSFVHYAGVYIFRSEQPKSTLLLCWFTIAATFQKMINNKEKKKHYVMHIFEGDPTYTNRKH